MERIGSGFRNGVDGTGRVVAVLRGQSVHFHFEFLESVWKWKRQVQIVFGIVVRSPVEHVIETAVHAAADLDDDSRVIPDSRVKRGIGRGNGSSGEEDQFGGIAAIERQLQNPLVIDDIAYSGTAGFDESRVGLDFHFIGDLSDLKNGIHCWSRSNLQRDSGLYISPEAGQSRFDRIRSDRQVLQYV